MVMPSRFVRLDVTDDASVAAATDFNEHRGTQTVEEGAEAIVRYALIAVDGPTGGFFDRNGAETLVKVD